MSGGVGIGRQDGINFFLKTFLECNGENSKEVHVGRVFFAKGVSALRVSLDQIELSEYRGVG